jgi:glycosyltransferase involved in cell wall biosynthesis
VIQALSSLRKRIPRVHAYIAGQVPERHTLRKMITKIGLEPNTTVTGLLPTQEYRGLLKSVDVLVAPSYEEACPFVHLEAMAMGKPIVAGKTGGVREFVKNGRNGILVDLKSECIAKAILRLQRDTEFKNNIARNSLRDITEFDWDRIVERYVKVYQSLVPPRRIQLSFQDAHTAATPSLPRQTGDGPHQVPI